MAIPSIKKEELVRVLGTCFDVDGDSMVSPAELCYFLNRTIGEELDVDDAKAFIQSMNSNGSDKLDVDGFMKIVEEEDEEEKYMFEAFNIYDMEGIGCITAKSLKGTLSRLGTERDIEECKAMICKVDRDGDEVLSFEEFKAMVV